METWVWNRRPRGARRYALSVAPSATPELILILNRVAGSSCGSQFAANGSHVGPCVFCLLYVGYISASVNKPVAIWETVVREVFEGAVLVQ